MPERSGNRRGAAGLRNVCRHARFLRSRLADMGRGALVLRLCRVLCQALQVALQVAWQVGSRC